MDSTDGLLIAILVVLIAGSAFFSGSETALSTINRIRVRNAADEGDKRAKLVLKVADDYERTLSTVLIGNNIVNIASASIATVLFTKFFGGELGATLSTIVMTIVVLIFGEVLPKSFAKANADKVAFMVAGVVDFLRKLFKPFVFFFVTLSNFMNRKTADQEKPSVTEEELKYIIESIEEEGVLEQDESNLVQSALELDEIEVQEILTPRVDMIAFDVEDPWEDLIHLVTTEGVSRIPVYEGSIDHVIGVVRVKDVLMAQVAGKHDVKALITPVMFIHRTMNVSQLLTNLRRDKMQMAIVTDDYGGTLGLVTMEDALEELVGEIWDEYDQVEIEFAKIGVDTYEVSGDYNVYDMMEQLDCDTRNFDTDYNTVSGWTLEEMEHIPSPGESFVYENLRVTVQEMEDQRITKLKVEKLHLPEVETEEE